MSYCKMPRKEFEAKLAKDFPNLFTDMHGDMRKTCMAWGIDTGPGWYDLIYDLSAKLEKLITALPEEKEEDGEKWLVRSEYKAEQVKEKFGSLRYYLSAETKEMSKLVGEAEDKSATICEQCGESGKLRADGWMRTLCELCEKKISRETAV